MAAGGGSQAPETSETADAAANDPVDETTVASVAITDFSSAFSQGPGFKFINDNGDFVDFRITDALPDLPLQLGQITLFDLPDGGQAKYETSEGRVKEEIILDKRPFGDSVAFNFSSTNLVPMKKEDGGYELLSGAGAKEFDISAPTVNDAAGQSGQAALEFSQGQATIKIDPAFLDNAVYPITIDPTVRADYRGGSGFSSQHNTFFDGNRYWVFYSDSNDLLAKSSTDGITWPGNGTSIAPEAGGSRDGVYLATWYAGSTKVYIAYVYNTYLYAKSGTISGASISWSAAKAVFIGAQYSHTYPSITRDAIGRLWVGARYKSGANYWVRARRSLNPDDITTWDSTVEVSQSTTSTNVVPQIVPLAGGSVFVAYAEGAEIKGRYYNETSQTWAPAIGIATAGGADWAHLPSAVVKDNVVHVGYSASGDSLKYKTLAAPYTTPSAEEALANDVGHNVSLSYDTSKADIYISYSHTIGGSGKQLRQAKLSYSGRKTILGNISNSFSYVEALKADGTKRDVTIAAADDTNADLYNSSGFLVNAVNDGFVVASAQKFSYINVRLSQVSSVDLGLVAYYWNGASFVFLNIDEYMRGLRDSDGYISIPAVPAGWKRDGSGLYKIKIFATSTPGAVKPIGSQIVPYQDIAQVAAAYSTDGDPFVIWREGRGTSFSTWFSTNRASEKLGLEGQYQTHSHDLKTANAAVNLDNGNLVLSVNAPATPARGVPASPTLTYNSQSSAENALGFGWTSNLFSRLLVGWTDGSILYQDGDGTRHLFDYDASTTAFSGPPELQVNLTKNGSDYLLKTKDQITYTFDSSGTLRTVKDRNDNATTYNYDGEGKLTSVVSASNTTTMLGYDESVNRVASITDAAGRSMNLGYSAAGDLTTIVDSMNNTTSLGYDANHNLTAYTDGRSYTTNFAYSNDKVSVITDPAPLSYQTKFTYNRTSTEVDRPRTDLNDKTVYSFNSSGLLASLVEPSPGGTTTYQYDNDFNLTLLTKANQAVTTSTYDASGNLTSQIDPLGHTTYWGYNGKNDIVSTTDALGYKTTYSYDSTGNLTNKINADNTTETYLPNAYGQNTKVTNTRGYDTTYTYTSLGLITKEIFSNNASMTHEFNLAGSETTTTDPLGAKTKHQYDLLGQETTSTDPLGNVTAYAYDAVGNRTSVTNARGKTTTYDYDQLNRLWREIKPLNTITIWQYDEAGNKAAETNPRSFTTTFGYDALNRLTKSVYDDDSSNAIGYDSVGDKISEINQNGAETTYAYDAAGRMKAKTDALQKTTAYEYNALGKETSETNARGATTQYGYDALGRMKVTTDALVHVTSYAYDAAGNKTKVIDARNNTTTIGYDAFNRAVSTTDPLGYNSHTVYDAAGRKTSETNQVGHKTDFFYDAAGRLIRREENNGPITYMGYDAGGNNTTEAKSMEISLADMEEDDGWTGGSFDSSNTKQANKSRKLTSTGSATSTTDAITLDWSTNYYPTTSTGGLQFWVCVDNADNLNTAATNDVILDSTGTTLTNYYRYSLNDLSPATGWNLIQIPRTSFTAVNGPTFSDIKRLIFKITAKPSTTVNVSFDDAKIVAASKITASRVYDDLDRVSSETDAKGATTSYTYDGAGNRETVTDPKQKVTSYQYDAFNRETTVTDPMFFVTSRGYDSVGNKVSEIDAEGKTTTYEYDAVGRQTKTIDPLGKVTAFVYDSAGNKTAEIKSDNTTVTYDYDLANRLTSMANELGQNATYILDPVGNQEAIIPALGSSTTNVYDGNNRLTTTTVAGQVTTHIYNAAGNKISDTMPGGKRTIYRYNELGQTTSTVDPDGRTTSFTYDIRGNRITQIEPSISVWYTYDETGREVKMVDSIGRIKQQTQDQKGNLTGAADINGSVGYGYDDNDRLRSLRVAGETSTTYTYDKNGRRKTYNQSNAVNSTYRYDDSGKLAAFDTRMSGGAKLLDYEFTYIDESNIGTELIEHEAGRPTQSYGYDNADQLTRWKNTSGVETTYTFDAAGNRTAVKKGSDTTVTFGYATSTSQLNAMVDGIRATSLGYDFASGSLTSMSNGTDTTTYTWTGANRLASISSSSTSATFTYDAEGKRTSKTVNGTTTKFVYDDIRLIAEKDVSDTVTAKYFYDDAGKLISMKRGGNTYYFHLDHRGDVMKITDASQSVVASYSYDPWGNILNSSETTSNLQPFRYAGYYWDKETGLYYLINRYYDPILGRFISKDPASDPEEVDQGPAETNPYAYAANNPVMATDPDGLRLLYYTSPMMRGEDVRWVQFRLMMAGLRDMLAPFGADGIFGYLTKSAVIRFQSNLGIVADGIVGPVTTDRLVNIWGDRYVALPPPGTGNWIAPAQTLAGQGGNPESHNNSEVRYSPEDVSAQFRDLCEVNGSVAKRAGETKSWPATYMWFYNKVKPQGPWDYKHNKYGYGSKWEVFGVVLSGEDLGNVHYGYVGTAAGFNKDTLLLLPGVLNIKQKFFSYKNSYGLAYATRETFAEYVKTANSYLDSPRDTAMVKKGIELRRKGFSNPMGSWWG